jgi:hypothetical protein
MPTAFESGDDCNRLDRVHQSGHLHPGHGGTIHVVVPVLIVIGRPYFARIFPVGVQGDHPLEYMRIGLPARGLAILLRRDGAKQTEFCARPEVPGFLIGRCLAEPRRAGRLAVVEQFQATHVTGAGGGEAQLQSILTHSR